MRVSICEEQRAPRKLKQTTFMRNLNSHVDVAKDCVPLACYNASLRLGYPRLEGLSGLVSGRGHSAGQEVHSYSECDPSDMPQHPRTHES